MVVDNQKIALAVSILQHAREDVAPLLSDVPDLAVTADHVLLRMIRSLEHTTQVAKNPVAAEPRKSSGEMKVFFGKRIPEAPSDIEEALAEVEPSMSEMDAALEEVNKAYLVFPDFAAADIREFYSEQVIRGVAKRAGMNVTPTTPRHLTNDYIESIKKAIGAKAEADAKVEEAERATAEVMTSAKEPVMNAEAAMAETQKQFKQDSEEAALTPAPAAIVVDNAAPAPATSTEADASTTDSKDAKAETNSAEAPAAKKAVTASNSKKA